MSKLKFYKLHGAGNNYIYFDCIDENKESVDKIIDSVVEISDVNFGIGSDGVILLLDSDKANLKMRIFNADGSEAEMCGNGVRCCAKLANKLLLTADKAKIETGAGMVETEIIGDEVRVKMFNPPKVFAQSEIVNVCGKVFDFHRVDMGNPHAVIFTKDVAKFDVEKYGKPIENSVTLFPDKTNVEFFEEVEEGVLNMRVWERGSGETLACGTGACATAGVYRLLNNNEYNEITVKMLGGDLKLSWGGDDFFMQGGATFVCEGIIDTDDLTVARACIKNKNKRISAKSHTL